MDSNLHLGLNSPDNQKVLWRHVLHCAPLITKGFTSQNKTDGNLVRYHYGSYDGPAGHKNYVYEVEDVEAQYSYEGYVGQANYLLK
jgi:hypothetical protein